MGVGCGMNFLSVRPGSQLLLFPLCGVIFGNAMGLCSRSNSQASSDPQQADRLHAFKRYLAWR